MDRLQAIHKAQMLRIVTRVVDVAASYRHGFVADNYGSISLAKKATRGKTCVAQREGENLLRQRAAHELLRCWVEALEIDAERAAAVVVVVTA